MSPNRKKHQEQFRKLGQAISATRFVTDPNIGITLAQPWKVVKGATGYYGLQIDTRHGLCLQSTESKDGSN